MTQTEYDTVFETTLRNRVKVKNIPNASFEPDRFSFGDYFDMDAFKETYTGTVADDQAWVDWSFEPYEMYFTGVPEINWTRHCDGMYWFDVSVALPADEDRQELLAHLVADAWERRQCR